MQLHTSIMMKRFGCKGRCGLQVLIHLKDLEEGISNERNFGLNDKPTSPNLNGGNSNFQAIATRQ